MKKYLVRVTRPIIQSAVIEVEADSEEQAAEIASVKADRLSDEDWDGGFEREAYSFDVPLVLDVESDLSESGESKSALLDSLRHPTTPERYLLLRADIFSGEGSVVLQPWLREISPLMLSDLGDDWASPLADIDEEAIEDVQEWLEGLERSRASNIIAFPWWKRRD